MNFFLLTDEEKVKQKLDTEYRTKVSVHVKNKNIDLLEYAYLLDYYENKGTIVNSSWYLNIINKLKDKEFCAIISDIFPTLFKHNEDKIEFTLINLADDIIKDKKKIIEFTKDQTDAIKQIFDFLPDFNVKSYGLYGYAGTGKTTIIVEMITYLLKNKLMKSVAFTAPTNQAVNVIKSKFKSYLNELYISYFKKNVPVELNFDEILDKILEHGIKIDFITIHKLLKFEMDFGSEGETIFVRGSGESLVGQYELIIIDECSMIPMKLVEHIFAELRTKTQKKSDNLKKIPKIVFCGDPAQLPPVNEKLSIIFLKDPNDFKYEEYSKDKDCVHDDENDVIGNVSVKCQVDKNKHKTLVNDIVNMSSITLKKVMRSKLECVTNICYQIRLWTMGEIKLPDMQTYIGKGAYVYKYGNVSKLASKWFQQCLKLYNSGQSCNIILTWTNKQAIEYNQSIRNTIFKSKTLKKYEVGDVLMLSDFYNISSDQESGYAKVKGENYLDETNKFYTSEQIKVVKIEIINKKINNFNIGMNKKALKLQNYKYYESQYKKIIDQINQETIRNYLCWKLYVSKISVSSTESDSICAIYVIHDESLKQYELEKELTSNKIKSLRKILVSKFRDKTNPIENNIIKPLWREWHKNMIEPFANVNYGYAITCHKGQGTNFYNVFVDIDDIVKNSNESEAKKCLYTAMTRTSNELHLLLK
jgi:hypothetical protein